VYNSLKGYKHTSVFLLEALTLFAYFVVCHHLRNTSVVIMEACLYSIVSLLQISCMNLFVSVKPLHNCSMSAQAIREEVEVLKTDFNNRMKQILFSSVLNAYYAGFVPCCFAQVIIVKVWVLYFGYI
jgi:hypothetical protein